MSAETHPTERLADLLDERLTGDERRLVEAHVRECPTCQEALVALSAARKALGRLPHPPMPADLEARVLRQIDQADAEGRRDPAGTPVPVTTPEGPFVESPRG
ncbi:MAG: hypothetical protein FJW27_18535 [Acidimicrobiia bacterium]|nr:hypothetical protein [Acidimicrobiia bacterium]